MSNWPPTCSRCGAPMIGGACPRCRAEARPLGGKVVFTGVGSAFPLEYVPIDEVEGAGPTITISNAAVPAGSLLVVYALVSHSGGHAGGLPTVTWGAETLGNNMPGGDGAHLTDFVTKAVTSGNAGSKTITFTDGDPDVARLAMVAFYVKGGAAYATGGLHTDGTGSGQGSTIVTASFGSVAALRLGVAFAFSYTDTTDLGSWSLPAIARAGTVVSAPYPNGGYLTGATLEFPAAASTSSLIRTIPAERAWFADSAVFR